MQKQFEAGDREGRKIGIGGSDAGAYCGKSKYKTPVVLWKEKIGDTEPEDLSDNQYVIWGTLHEATIRNYVNDYLKIPVVESEETHWHKTIPFMYTHVDGIKTECEELIEIKTSSVYGADRFGLEMTDDIPEEYKCQAYHMLSIFPEKKGVHFFVLIGGNDLRQYYVKRDNKIIEELEKSAVDFWKHVTDKTPPKPKNGADVEILFPIPTENKEVVAPIGLEVELNRMDALKGSIKTLEHDLELIKDHVKEYMKDSRYLLSQTGKKLASYYHVSKSGTDMKAFVAENKDMVEAYNKKKSEYKTDGGYRALRISKKKG